MEKIVGKIVSRKLRRSYPVKWNKVERTSSINRDSDVWLMVCTDIKSEADAISCSQKFIDSQPDTY